jgi:hypothetical protein
MPQLHGRSLPLTSPSPHFVRLRRLMKPSIPARRDSLLSRGHPQLAAILLAVVRIGVGGAVFIRQRHPGFVSCQRSDGRNTSLLPKIAENCRKKSRWFFGSSAVAAEPCDERNIPRRLCGYLLILLTGSGEKSKSQKVETPEAGGWGYILRAARKGGLGALASISAAHASLNNWTHSFVHQ